MNNKDNQKYKNNLMSENVVLVRVFKTTGNKKIIAIFKRYNELKNFMEENKEKLANYEYEIWRETTIKNKFKI